MIDPLGLPNVLSKVVDHVSILQTIEEDRRWLNRDLQLLGGPARYREFDSILLRVG